MSLRVGHREREEAVESLRAHAVDGRLDEIELDARIDRAYDAVTRADLDEVFVDLPQVHSRGELQQWQRHQRITFYHQLGIYTPVSFLLVCVAAAGVVGLWLPLAVIFAWGSALMHQALRIRTRPVLSEIESARPARLGGSPRALPAAVEPR